MNGPLRAEKKQYKPDRSSMCVMANSLCASGAQLEKKKNDLDFENREKLQRSSCREELRNKTSHPDDTKGNPPGERSGPCAFLNALYWHLNKLNMSAHLRATRNRPRGYATGDTISWDEMGATGICRQNVGLPELCSL